MDDETPPEREKRLRELFPYSNAEKCQLINDDCDVEFEETLSLIQRTVVFFSIIPLPEYDWIRNVISMSENMPICITISAARKQHFGFPLVYVNKQFEKTTGYNRDEIIGTNCKFLQPRIPIPDETTQHTIISNSLRFGMPTSVVITNVKKTGALFYNLIVLKPVIDGDGNYLYSIGIQTEITMQPINKTDIQNAMDVINILSNIRINIIS